MGSVEGPMADDTIHNYVEDYLDGKITKEDFLKRKQNNPDSDNYWGYFCRKLRM